MNPTPRTFLHLPLKNYQAGSSKPDSLGALSVGCQPAPSLRSFWLASPSSVVPMLQFQRGTLLASTPPMPEGHSVARWSDTLQIIVGQQVTSITVPPRWRERAFSIVGARVTRVHAHGKHLVLHFSSGWVIHAHALQYGSWQIGPLGQELRKEARFARLRLTTQSTEAVFFHGPVMEVLTEAELREHERFTSLGPDLLHSDFDTAGAISRIRAEGAREIGDTVLDQRVVSGIGNIYKSALPARRLAFPSRSEKAHLRYQESSRNLS